VLRNLKQIEDTQEAGLPSQGRSDIRKSNRRDRIHLDLSFFHRVPSPHFDVRTGPNSDAAGDFSATNSVAETLGEKHKESLYALIGIKQQTEDAKLFPL
jgi:hypothetical protein